MNSMRKDTTLLPESSMELLKSCFLMLLIFGLVSNLPVLAQQDFLSYDCGYDGETYSDEKTNLPYSSDKGIIDGGASMNTTSDNVDRQFRSVRSFPEQNRNCYSLRATQGPNKSYLIRASFMYGNYDGLNKTPVFELNLGVNFWATVKFAGVNEIVRWEVVHEASTDRLDVCVLNNGSGTPFVSVLELRPLPDTAVYKIAPFPFLVPFRRLNFGAPTNLTVIRYPDDIVDRIWMPPAAALASNTTAITSSILNGNLSGSYQLPPSVMRTAAEASNNGSSLSFSWVPLISRCYVYIHLAEVATQQGDVREFDIFLNNDTRPFQRKGYRPESFADTLVTDAYVGGDKISLNLSRTELSTLPPILNAIEIYMGLAMLLSPTIQTDVDAMEEVKSAYSLKKNWQGDPCFPATYRWTGIECTTDGTRRITSLKLSSSGLTGPVDPSLSGLTSLVHLDLSNNSLNGAVPEFLGEMQSLKFLNLTANKFNGTVPAALLEKANSNKLQLYLDDNLCPLGSCDKKKEAPVAAIVGSTVALLLLLVAIAVFWWLRMKKRVGQIVEDGKLINVMVYSHKLNNGPPVFEWDTPAINKYHTVFVNKSNDEDGKVETTREDHKALHSNGAFAEPYERNVPFGSNNPMYVSGEEVMPLDFKNPQFTFSEVKTITDNFNKVIGKGGFGSVYYGCLNDNTKVAVKMLSASSLQGSKQFRAEARLLMTVHHKNLTSLVGYCDEGHNMALIYEYMANGDVQRLLSEGDTGGLSWEERLRIAIDAAQGLEYMHNGIKPPVIHRDVKTANILLDEKFQAKIGDFGLSRMLAVESKSYVTTNVVGTAGYLDPEYFETQKLNEKSDVYSFGVVLLEVITGQRPIVKEREPTYITQWVAYMVARGDIGNIVDPYIGGDFDTNCVWKAVEIAMACVAHSSAKRPTMTHVLGELNKCLDMTRPDSRSDNSIEMLGLNLGTRMSMNPAAR